MNLITVNKKSIHYFRTLFRPLQYCSNPLLDHLKAILRALEFEDFEDFLVNKTIIPNLN